MTGLKKFVITGTLVAVGITLSSYAEASAIVRYMGISKGVILVKTSKRRLYVGIGKNKAIRYPIGVGRLGKQWSGTRVIRSKRLKPAWKPTAQIIRDNPKIKRLFKGGAANNPMGAAALILSGYGKYAIHGTNRPNSIGRFVSYGCIRMYNQDIRQLYSLVKVGTKVIVQK